MEDLIDKELNIDGFYKAECKGTSRHYCFTIWKTDVDLCELAQNLDVIKYLIYQKEQTKGGKLHLQCYIELKRPTRGTTVAKLLGLQPKTFWFGIRKGTREEARNYCMKEDSRVEIFKEFGSFDGTGQGSRSDITGLYEMMKKGSSLVEIQNANPAAYARYYKALDRMQSNLLESENCNKFRKVTVNVLWGDAGCGKTSSVYKSVKQYSDVFQLETNDSQDHVWWDGYIGQKTLLIDEFYGGSLKYGNLLRILDGYPLRLPVKGGFTWAAWETVYITSNKPPEHWYQFGLTPALNRRIASIHHLVRDVTKLTQEVDDFSSLCDILKEPELVPNLTPTVFSDEPKPDCHEVGVIEGPTSGGGVNLLNNSDYIYEDNVDEPTFLYDSSEGSDSDFSEDNFDENKIELYGGEDMTSGGS